MYFIKSFLITRARFYYGWVIVAASGCAMFSRNAAGSLTLSVFLYPMARELGWSRTLIAGGSSIGGLISIFGSPISGWAVDRIGSKWVLVIGILILGASTFCLGAQYIAFDASGVAETDPVHLLSFDGQVR